jgi:hypothetical protein
MRLLFTEKDLAQLSFLQKAGNLTAEDAIMNAIYISAYASLRDSRQHEGPFTAGRVDAWDEPYGTLLLDPQAVGSLFAEERKKPCTHYVDFSFDAYSHVQINGAKLYLENIGNSDIREILFFAAAAVRALEKEGSGAKLVAGNYDGYHAKPRSHTRLKTPFDQTLRAAFGRTLRGKSGKKEVKAVKFQANPGTAPKV